jgi:hypothetical protein
MDNSPRACTGCASGLFVQHPGKMVLWSVCVWHRRQLRQWGCAWQHWQFKDILGSRPDNKYVCIVLLSSGLVDGRLSTKDTCLLFNHTLTFWVPHLIPTSHILVPNGKTYCCPVVKFLQPLIWPDNSAQCPATFRRFLGLFGLFRLG